MLEIKRAKENLEKIIKECELRKGKESAKKVVAGGVAFVGGQLYGWTTGDWQVGTTVSCLGSFYLGWHTSRAVNYRKYKRGKKIKVPMEIYDNGGLTLSVEGEKIIYDPGKLFGTEKDEYLEQQLRSYQIINRKLAEELPVSQRMAASFTAAVADFEEMKKIYPRALRTAKIITKVRFSPKCWFHFRTLRAIGIDLIDNDRKEAAGYKLTEAVANYGRRFFATAEDDYFFNAKLRGKVKACEEQSLDIAYKCRNLVLALDRSAEANQKFFDELYPPQNWIHEWLPF